MTTPLFTLSQLATLAKACKIADNTVKGWAADADRTNRPDDAESLRGEAERFRTLAEFTARAARAG